MRKHELKPANIQLCVDQNSLQIHEICRALTLTIGPRSGLVQKHETFGFICIDFRRRRRRYQTGQLQVRDQVRGVNVKKCPELWVSWAVSLWHKRAGIVTIRAKPRWTSTNGSGAVWLIFPLLYLTSYSETWTQTWKSWQSASTSA